MSERALPKRHRATVDVFKFRDYRAFLAAHYAAKKARGYSYRLFARAVGLGAPNYLKLVIEGERNLSQEMAPRFARACGLEGESQEYFCLLVAFNQATTDAVRNELHERLSRFARFRTTQRLELAHKEYHESWFIPAVRELIACAGFVEDPAWIATALLPPISEQQAKRALSVLLQLGMTERDEVGRLRQATRAVSTGAQASGLYLRNYHAEMMARAAHAMQEIPAAERYISGLTLSASPATLAEVKRRILEFRQELASLCDADPLPSQIAHFNLHLFPLSRDLASVAKPEAPSETHPAVKRRASAARKKP